mgnify:CR=1 FL=1
MVEVATDPAPVTLAEMADLMHRVLYGHALDSDNRYHRNTPAEAVQFTFLERDIDVAHAVYRLVNAAQLVSTGARSELARASRGLARHER